MSELRVDCEPQAAGVIGLSRVLGCSSRYLVSPQWVGIRVLYNMVEIITWGGARWKSTFMTGAPVSTLFHGISIFLSSGNYHMSLSANP